MTTRLMAAVAALAFAVGILAGSAGTILVRDASVNDRSMSTPMGGHMAGDGTHPMMGLMSGSMMGPRAAMPMHGHDTHHVLMAPGSTR